MFVVKDGNVAELRQVVIKRTQGGESVIGSGLKAGEQVVVDGQLRLVNGAASVRRPKASRHRPTAPQRRAAARLTARKPTCCPRSASAAR